MAEAQYIPVMATVSAVFYISSPEPQVTGRVIAIEQVAGQSTPSRYLIVLDVGDSGPLWIDHGKVLSTTVT